MSQAAGDTTREGRAHEELATGDRHVLGIDLLRFSAAAIVMVFHLGFSPRAIDLTHGAGALHPPIALIFSKAPIFPALAPWSWFGWVGVEVFFVISGFVIANSAVGARPLTFVRRRLVRLMPAVWICASLALAAMLAAKSDHAPQLALLWAKTMVLVPHRPWLTDVYWTLCVEIGFYALVFLLLAMGAFGRIEPVMAVIGLAGTLLWIVVAATGRWQRLEDIDTLKFLLVRYGCTFAVGVFLWLISRRGPTLFRLAVLGLCSVGSLIEIVWTAKEKSVSGFAGSPIIPCLVWLVAVGAVWASVRFNASAHKLIGRWSGQIRQLGLMTYPLYLIHVAIGYVMLDELARLPAVLDLALAMSASLALAWVISRFVEPPTQRWLDRVLKQLGARVTPRAPVVDLAAPP